MNRLLILALLLVVTLSLGASTNSASPANSSFRYWAVRAEFVAADSLRGKIDTDIVVQNTSHRYPLKIRDLIVLGRHGANTIVKVHKTLNGGTVPPMGTLVVPLDTLGLKRGKHHLPSPNDVATVVLEWEGRNSNHARLTAVIKQWGSDQFGTRVETAYGPWQ